MKLTDGEKTLTVLVLIATLVLVVWGSLVYDFSNDVIEPQSFTNDFVEALPEDGTPVLEMITHLSCTRHGVRYCHIKET